MLVSVCYFTRLLGSHPDAWQADGPVIFASCLYGTRLRAQRDSYLSKSCTELLTITDSDGKTARLPGVGSVRHLTGQSTLLFSLRVVSYYDLNIEVFYGCLQKWPIRISLF